MYSTLMKKNHPSILRVLHTFKQCMFLPAAPPPLPNFKTIVVLRAK